MKKVSVIVPVYGVEAYIEKCARSIFEQTYPNLDIIFVDDCSPDHSVEIINRTLIDYPHLKGKTQIISHTRNLGLAGARQTGLKVATGFYTIQIDGDDYISPRMIASMVAKAESEDADIVICDLNLVQGNKIVPQSEPPSLVPVESMKQILTGIIRGSVVNKLIVKELYENNHIRFTQGLNMREDLSVTYKLFYYAKKIAYLPEPLYYYVQRKGSYCSAARAEKNQIDSMMLVRGMNDFCKLESITDTGIIEAFNFSKASIYSFIVLYWNPRLMDRSLFAGIRVKHFLFHPTLPIHCKIAGACALMKLQPVVYILRKIAKMLITLLDM